MFAYDKHTLAIFTYDKYTLITFTYDKCTLMMLTHDKFTLTMFTYDQYTVNFPTRFERRGHNLSSNTLKYLVTYDSGSVPQ